jgi:hypothetical protein
MDRITFEHDRVVARPRDGERGRESRDTASGDDELHIRKLQDLHRCSPRNQEPGLRRKSDEIQAVRSFTTSASSLR